MSAGAVPAQRLRIAVLCRRFEKSGGGAERYAAALVDRLASRHEIHVFAQRFGEAAAGSPPPAVTLHRIPFAGLRPRWVNQLWFGACSWWRTRRGFDLVHSHENTWHGQVQTVHVRALRVGLFKARRLLMRPRRWFNIATSPRLWVYLGLEAARLRPGSQRSGSRRLVIAVSRPLQSEVEAAYPRLHGRTALLAPGVDAARMRPADDPAQREQARDKAREQARATWQLPAGETVLLFVANDFAKKGLAQLLASVAQFARRPLLLVVGDGGGELDAWRRRAEQLGIKAQVRFAGALPDPAPAYEVADALVHPTSEDTFGMVVLEAMAHGLPVIVSAAAYCGIAADLVDDRDALILARPTDVDALASAIARLLAEPQLRRRLAAAGLAFAAERDWDRVAERQDELYRRLLP